MPDPTPPATPAPGLWLPPTAEELQKLLPHYEITTLLGRGGMGAVYKARQIALDRSVAIKILSNQLEEADASFVERFKNEARALGRLSHPGIVGVYDFGEAANGLLYIVMEFIDGTDVSRMIAQQKRLHTEHAMAITAHVCDALAYAHERGIIHRDIKPANIMVGYDGAVKVADFGLAKMTQSGLSGLTQSGMAMGTLHYMAPEALMLGSAVDHRADIYAVGVMLYQMLTGQLPQGMFKLPSKLMAGLDPRYDKIITKAIMEDRESRYQKVVEMRRDLDGILTQPVIKVEPEARQARTALSTQARPQRLEERSSNPSQSVVKSQSGLAWLWVTLLILSVFGSIAWLVLVQSDSSSQTAQERPPPANSPSTSPPAAADMPGQPSAAGVAPHLATKEQPFVNSLGMKFVPVPGTKVLFSIWVTRVQDYEKYAQENDVKVIRASHTQGPTHPVVNVKWSDAKAFCAWLTANERKLGRISAQQEYRLPTDAEWSAGVGLRDEQGNSPAEKANDPKNMGTFPWGPQWPPPKGAGNYPKILQVDDFDFTSPVGSFAANEHGLFDMGGNVMQWCEDKYDEKIDGDARVLRGEYYRRNLTNTGWAPSLLSSYRFRSSISTLGSDTGFRCVLTLPSSPTSETTAPAQAPTVSLAPRTGPTTPDPKQATKDQPFVNSLGMKFVPVPIKGGPTDTQQSGKRVLFCIHETRKRDYAQHAAENPGVDPTWKVVGEADHPVAAVSWEEAKKFCDWLSKKEGLTYRLPFDHEWSCAVGIGELEDVNASPVSNRAKTQGIYPWGTAWPPPKGAGNFDPSLGADDFDRTAPVMQFAANSLGIYDLGGNVGEFCDDVITGSATPYKARGGIFDGRLDPERTLLSSSRISCQPNNHNGSFGFRVVVVFDERTAANSSSPSTPDLKQASKEQPFENSLGMKFVPVPGTEVLFSIWDTRLQDYQVFAKEAGREVKTGREYNLGPTYPMTMITWDDAKAFCVWLTERDRKSQLMGPSEVYRLPTDEEWSIAAGLPTELGGPPEKKSDRIPGYPWGTDKMPPKNYGNFMGEGESPPHEGFKKMWIMGYQDGFAFASPVGTFPPDANGLFDMMGNVYQYVEDWYDEQKNYRTLRGTTFWGYINPTSRRTRRSRELAGDFNIGFRCVVELQAAPPAPTTTGGVVVPKP